MTELRSFTFRFGEFEIREDEYLLIRGEGTEPVEPKAFRVLLYLLRNPGRLVKKDEILGAVWDGYSVSDNSLTRCIAILRRLLGDDARNPRYIATVHTVGYRLVCRVEIVRNTVPRTEVSDSVVDQPRKKFWMVGPAIAAMLVASVITDPHPMRTPATRQRHSHGSIQRVLDSQAGELVNRGNFVTTLDGVQ